MASQRAATLKKHFQGPNLRPILTSLNGDSAWLMSFPLPASQRLGLGKSYYHIVSEPWLSEPITNLHWLLIHLDFAAPPAFSSATAVEALVLEIEDAAGEAGVLDPGAVRKTSQSLIDAIFINFHYDDHMHEPTLRQFDPSIPVFAATEAANAIRTWNHFKTVVAQRDLNPSSGNGAWQDLHPEAPLPKWLSIFRIPGHNPFNFATGIVWSDPDAAQPKHEALIYSPHGIKTEAPALQTLLHAADPPVSTLAMMCALKENYTWGSQLTLGVTGALALASEAKPKYWIRTADSALKYSGLVMLFVRDIFHSLESGLGGGKPVTKGNSEEILEPTDVPNGSCFVLE